MVKDKKKRGKKYFTQETEDAIIRYNKEPDPAIRSRIYEREIHYPFFKLTQNIIHTFKFYHTEVENLEHLQHEIITFLLGKMYLYNQPHNVQSKIKKTIIKEFGEKYDKDFLEYVDNADKISQSQINEFVSSLKVSPECRERLEKIKVPKAYSYFGTIVKRWLIAYTTKNYQKKINKTPVSELTKEGSDYSYSSGEEKVTSELDRFMDLYLEYCTENIFELFPKKNDAQIADAVLEIFRKREDLEVFNKKALYIYIREMVDVKTPKITKITTRLKSIFNDNYIFYLNNGYVNFNS